jgi:hypothetical protein
VVEHIVVEQMIIVLTVNQVVALHILGHRYPKHGLGFDRLLWVSLQLLRCQLTRDRADVHEYMGKVLVEGLLINFCLLLLPLFVEISQIDAIVVNKTLVEATTKLHVFYLVGLVELVFE